MNSFPFIFSPLDQSLQPKKTTSTQPYNSIFASGRIRSKPCLSSRHGSKPNHPPLLCGPKSSPTCPLTLPLPYPMSPPRSPLHLAKISGHDPLPSYPFISHHFTIIYTSPIVPSRLPLHFSSEEQGQDTPITPPPPWLPRSTPTREGCPIIPHRHHGPSLMRLLSPPNPKLLVRTTHHPPHVVLRFFSAYQVP
jgi:hypothetical protein